MAMICMYEMHNKIYNHINDVRLSHQIQGKGMQ